MSAHRAKIGQCLSCDAAATVAHGEVRIQPSQVWVVTDLGTPDAVAVLHEKSCRDVPPESLTRRSTVGDVAVD